MLFSPLIEDTIPSFILMVFQGEEGIIYLYTLNDKNKKFEVNKFEYTKGADNYKNVENNEEEEEKKEEVNQEQHEMKDVEPNEQGSS